MGNMNSSMYQLSLFKIVQGRMRESLCIMFQKSSSFGKSILLGV